MKNTTKKIKLTPYRITILKWFYNRNKYDVNGFQSNFLSFKEWVNTLTENDIKTIDRLYMRYGY